VRTPNRKHIRKGVLKLYSTNTMMEQYYSTGVATNGFVYAFSRRWRTWHEVPEGYFAAEFTLDNAWQAYWKSEAKKRREA
jgi:hypothetical protein